MSEYKINIPRLKLPKKIAKSPAKYLRKMAIDRREKSVYARKSSHLCICHAIHDYLEDLSADMPSAEQWTEPLSAEVRYRWRPQKDCFYLDKNIDDYLRELYEMVRRG